MARRWSRKPQLLLLPNIPQPLHGVNPRSVLGGKWWDEERRKAYASTNYHCEACGVHKTQIKLGNKWLEGHEVYDTDYSRGILLYVRTTPLCPPCHQYIHDGRLKWLLDTQQISRSRYVAVIQHGDRILHEAGLERPTHAERDERIQRMLIRGECARWNDWRLVVYGNEYPPKYESAEEQNRAYHRSQSRKEAFRQKRDNRKKRS